jgi:hypothetical protein
MPEPLNWRAAFQQSMVGDNATFEAWRKSPEREAMCAEANGKMAVDFYESGIPGMAGGYAKIAVHHAHIAYPDLADNGG